MIEEIKEESKEPALLEPKKRDSLGSSDGSVRWSMLNGAQANKSPLIVRKDSNAVSVHDGNVNQSGPMSVRSNLSKRSKHSN